MTVRDREVVELLRDEPELLALADAIAETHDAGAEPPRRMRMAVRATTAAVALAAVVAVALAAPWQEGERGGILERALAAVGDDGPVVHVVFRHVHPGVKRIDLETGRELPASIETEIWFDDERGRLRSLGRRAGRVSFDHVQDVPRGTRSEVPAYGPVPVGLASYYRDALEQGRARVVGEGSIDGRHVYWLDVPQEPLRRVRPTGRAQKRAVPAARDVSEPPVRFSSRVAIDSATYRPLLVRVFLNGVWVGIETEVVEIETLPRSEADFVGRSVDVRSPRELRAYGAAEAEELTPAQARTALPRPPLWPGVRIAGLELTSVKRLTIQPAFERVVRRSVRGKPVTTFVRGLKDGRPSGYVVELVYGTLPKSELDRTEYLQISQAPEGAAGSQIVAAGGPPPPAGLLDLEDNLGSAVPQPSGEVELGPKSWYAQMRKGGLYISLRSSSPDAILAAARALEPIAAG